VSNKFKIVSFIFIVCLLISCNKEYLYDENTSNHHRGNENSINCWSEITDWTGLMNDSSITISPIPQIPTVGSNYINWLNNKYNRVDIRSLTSENFSDLQCLKQYIGNRTLVQLGESSHGTKEYSQIKVRLIKFLHEQMGFDVIAFESGFFECFYTNENIDSLTEIEAMKNSIYFGVWGTNDVKELFTYIKSTQSTNHPLIFAGFDCFHTSRNKSLLKRASYLFEMLSKIDIQYANIIRPFDSINNVQLYNYNPSYFSQYYDSISSTYLHIGSLIDQHIDTLISYYPSNPILPLLLKQSITSTLTDINYIIKYFNGENFNADMLRDSAMSVNVSFLKEKQYPNKKIILWAHNYHIANSQYQHALYSDIKNMGTWLYEKYKNEMYTIGLYMLKGKTKTEWDWSVIDVPLPVSSNSLEAILYQPRKKYLFVDLLHHNDNIGTHWMYQTISAKSSGFANESMVIRNVYDGIVFIDSSSVPVYLP